MPVTPTYPGVYIEEIPSGVRTITGVATSLSAFMGRAFLGPANDPTPINSFADFERSFGGLQVDYPLSYAVRDFFLNGGSRAIVLRLFREPADGDGVARLQVGPLGLRAASPGEWGNALSIRVDHDGITDQVAARFGLNTDDLFNLTIINGFPDGPRERLRNLTFRDSPRRVDRISFQESQLIRVAESAQDPAVPDLPPEDTQLPDTPASADPTNPMNSPEDIAAFEGGAPSQLLDVTTYTGSPSAREGIFALDGADLFNILCIPPDTRGGDTDPSVYQAALTYCVARRALLVVDPPAGWRRASDITNNQAAAVGGLGLSGVAARNAALYFPRVLQADPLRDGQIDTFAACGAVAGVMARTDAQRGVWKAPAGIDAAVNGVQGLSVSLTDAENGDLNQLGINCLRSFPVAGRVVWGARTLRGADQLADEYKYVPVRRLALFIEESLYRGTQWVVFEPNDEPLWSQVRLNLGAFMHGLFRQGAFQGTTPRQAYLVKCDRETTTQADINLGVVNILVGFAPLRPAEFVIIRIQQLAGQAAA
jgi:uncharacterized protein